MEDRCTVAHLAYILQHTSCDANAYMRAQIWGYLPKDRATPRAVAVTDWGGGMDGADLQWQQAFVAYLVGNPIIGSFCAPHHAATNDHHAAIHPPNPIMIVW